MDAVTIRKLMRYEPKTGKFYWIIDYNDKDRRKGKVVKTSKCNGYSTISLFGRSYLVHRLAWLYIHGYFPEMIDHINGKRDDNRLCNLRSVTPQQNSWNSKRPENNSTGYKGVIWNSKVNKWQASIGLNGSTKYIGVFNSPIEAHTAYRNAAKLNFGDFANFGDTNNFKAKNFRYTPRLNLGRPREIDESSSPITLNLTEEQVAWLKMKARDNKVSVSKYLREIIDNKINNSY